MEVIKRKKLEKAFYNYELNRERANVNAVDLAYMGLGINYGKVNVQSSKGNTQEDKIIRAIDEAVEAYKWFKIVDNTIIRYKDDYRYKLIVCLFFNRQTPNRAVRKLNIDRATLFRWKNEILKTAEFWAHELGVKL